MAAGSEPWQAWMRRLQGIADTGLAYARDQYDVERYLAVRAVAAELGAHVGGGDAHQLAARLAADGKGHPTPKVDVRAAAFRDGRVLLVLERSDGGWTTPRRVGGHRRAARRRRAARAPRGVRLDARAAKLFAVHDRDRHNFPPHPQHIYKLFFLCELTADAPTGRPDNEVDDVQFFARDALPEQLSTGRTTQSQLEAAFAHHDDPSLPTEFD